MATNFSNLSPVFTQCGSAQGTLIENTMIRHESLTSSGVISAPKPVTPQLIVEIATSESRLEDKAGSNMDSANIFELQLKSAARKFATLINKSSVMLSDQTTGVILPTTRHEMIRRVQSK